MTQPVSDVSPTIEPGLKGVKNIIAIASGKGGVGKSTVASNLAVALKASGASVGLLDADIYGPSQPGLLGSKGDQPEIGDGYLHPVNRHGISFVSMGLFTRDDSPVIWRAPIAMKMIHQFLGGVIWGELDYLLLDLPPGTGDVQLTLAQQAQITGAIIVTTPQEVALGVARKGLRMFTQVRVPILGVIENMSGFICQYCGEETAIFHKGGGHRMAEEFDVPYLGALPLDPEIMMSGEDGVPVLNRSTDSLAARAILGVAGEVRDGLEKLRGRHADDEPESFEIGADGRLLVTWSDGHRGVHTGYRLRVSCPCASCVDEDSGRRTLDPKQVPLDIRLNGAGRVGRYGVGIEFSDGHNTGIYSFALLRRLCECDACTREHGSEQSNFSV